MGVHLHGQLPFVVPRHLCPTGKACAGELPRLLACLLLCEARLQGGQVLDPLPLHDTLMLPLPL